MFDKCIILLKQEYLLKEYYLLFSHTSFFYFNEVRNVDVNKESLFSVTVMKIQI